VPIDHLDHSKLAVFAASQQRKQKQSQVGNLAVSHLLNKLHVFPPFEPVSCFPVLEDFVI